MRARARIVETAARLARGGLARATTRKRRPDERHRRPGRRLSRGRDRRAPCERAHGIGAFAVPADRRLRVHLQLPHRCAARARRRDRLAVRAVVRLAEHLREPARPPGRQLPLRPVRDQRAGGAPLRARDERAHHDLEDGHRLAAGARRAHDRPLAGHRPRDAPYAPARRRGRRPHARAGGRMPRGRGRARAQLRTGLRLRREHAVVGARRRQARSARERGRRRRHAAHRPHTRAGGRTRARSPRAARGRARLLRAVVGGRLPRARDGRGGRGAHSLHGRVLAQVARRGRASPTTAGASRSSARR